MIEDTVLHDFVARLKLGEFDEHLMDAIASLSTEDLNEVAHALQEEREHELAF